MKKPTPMEVADEDLRALCIPLLESAEATPSLLAVVEPQVLALLTLASEAGHCSRIAIYRIDARLKLVRRVAFGLAALPPARIRLD